MNKIIFLLLLTPFLSNCQPLTIKGDVLNEQLEPIAGATVVLKRTGETTSSNDRGGFTFNNTFFNDSLIVSAVGYETRTVINNERGLLKIVLKRSINELDDVVIQAYGTTTRRFNTGNISSVSASVIEMQPVSNPLAALQGRIPGLIVTQSSGVAGSGFNLQLRGRTYLDQTLSRNDPLIIIDGVPFESGNLPVNQLPSATNNPVTTNLSAPTGLSPLHSINPADIQSIEVLKDADATAIYGSRGANGVIIITTKRGREGKTKFMFNINTGMSRPVRSMDFLNTTQYLQMRREAFANDGITPTVVNAPDLFLWDTTRNTSFKELLIGNTAVTNNIQASISGGAGGTQFLLSTGYHRETTVFPGSFGDARGSVQLNLSHSPASAKWDTRLSVMYSADHNRLFRNDLSRYLFFPPHLNLYTATGAPAWEQNGVTFASLAFTNPLAEQLKTYSAINKNLSANLMLNYHLFKGMVLRTSGGFNSFTTDERGTTPRAAIPPTSSGLASSDFSMASRNNWIIEPQAEYNTNIAKGALQVLIGSTFQERGYSRTTINATNYTSDLLLSSINAAGNVSASNNYELYRYTAFFGRTTFNWDEKYLINLSGRRDGSSRFAPERRFATFGAVGAAWIFSEEPFLKSLSFLSFGKIRGSYGVTGNDQIADYKYLDLWSSTPNPYASIPGLRPAGLFNPLYEWEKNIKKEVALELGFLGDRILISGAYFRNEGSNQLISYRLPHQTGFASVIKNMPAEVHNSGLELQSGATLFTNRHFTWKTSFNISFPSNKLVAFPGLETSSYYSFYEIGKSLTTYKRLKFLGVNPVTGLYSYEDFNGDGIISTSDDLQTLGNLDPKFYGGFSNSLSYNSWQLDVFFQFNKQTGENYLNSQSNTPAGFLYNQPTLVLDRWQKAGDITSIQRFGANSSSPVFPASSRLRASDAVYSDASFIRFKNLSIVYNIPEKVLSKMNMEGGKFYVQAQNLLTVTNFMGPDPETRSLYQLPPLRTIAFGIQFTF